MDQLADFYGHCTALANNLGKNVVQLGSLTKVQLYAVYHTAGQYVYPMPSRLVPEFDEISCISVLDVAGESADEVPQPHLVAEARRRAPERRNRGCR